MRKLVVDLLFAYYRSYMVLIYYPVGNDLRYIREQSYLKPNTACSTRSKPCLFSGLSLELLTFSGQYKLRKNNMKIMTAHTRPCIVNLFTGYYGLRVFLELKL